MTKTTNEVTSMKETKEGIIKFLESAQRVINDHKLQAQIAYNLKNAAKAKVADFKSLIEAIIEFKPALTKKLAELVPLMAQPVENSLKVAPPKKAPAKKEVTPPAQPAKATKKTKEAPKTVEQKVVPKQNISEKQIVIADMFHKELDTVIGHLKVNFDIKTIEDVRNAMESGKSLVFAFYWSKRHLKQYSNNYDSMGINGGKKFTEFENDIDLAMPVYASERGAVIYAASVISEVPYVILPDHLEIVDGMRFNGGTEFNIYELVEQTAQEAPKETKKETVKDSKAEVKAEQTKVETKTEAKADKKVVALPKKGKK